MRTLSRTLVVLFCAAVVRPAKAGEYRLFAPGEDFGWFGRSGTATAGDAAPAAVPAARPKRKLFDPRTVRISLAMLAAVPVAGYAIWWHGNDFTHFKFNHEHWFGRDTYAGGADKASHFVESTIVGHGMQRFYERLGHSPSDARWLAMGVVSLGGLIVEAGDGFKYGGASWEDAATNVLGGVVGAEVAYRGWDDVVGFRFGVVPSKNRGGATGPRVEHYSQEIYTADAKLAGIFRRARAPSGPLRYIMLSATYASRGYRELPPGLRERDLGVELGLNVPEILRAAGLPDSTWWQTLVYAFFDYVRLPYTAIGYRYDFNHGRWQGPNTGR